MRMSRLLLPALGLPAMLLLGPATPSARSQAGGAAQPVEILTADRVELKGHFYPGKGGRNAPTVLLLHAIGEDSRSAEWVGLAQALNAAGYAVLRFDFRGHGASTTVQPGVPNINPAAARRGFWDERENQAYVRGAAKRPTTISDKQFDQKYYLRILANDVAAAKAFLDERNDAGECNSGNLFLVGAKEGATIGAIWLNGEWNRFKVIFPPQFPGGLAKLDLQDAEGASVTAAVWLSMTSSLGGTAVSPSAILYKAAATNKVPMAFFYGEADAKAKQTAVATGKAFKLKKSENPFTFAVAVPRSEKLAGSKLLAKSLGTGQNIIAYFDGVQKGKTFSSKSRNAMTDSWAWQWQQAGTVRVMQQPAKVRGELRFFGFAPFLAATR